MHKIYIFFLVAFFVITSCNEVGKLSPVDISNSTKDTLLKPLYADYLVVEEFTIEKKQNRISLALDNCFLVISNEESYLGTELQLKQIHIKAPSEHTVEGISYPIEIQFIHKDTLNNFFIASVFVEEGDENTDLQTIINNIPQSEKVTVKQTLDVYYLFSQSEAYWTYDGTFTVKPFDVKVKWFIMKKPITASNIQINKLSNLIKTSILNKNINKTIPIGDRIIKSFE
jgi:carbonic anhydrase